jgi:cell division protein FtsN
MTDISRSNRNAPLWATVVLVVIGVLLALVAGLYFADTANNLPSFLPGHQAGSARHHTKHGIAAAIVAVLAFAGAWMSGGRRTT